MRSRLLFIVLAAAVTCARYFPMCTLAAQGSGTPYGGTPASLPGLIQAENFNDGGAQIAYHDTDSADNGGTGYRATQVDIECAMDPPEPSGCADGAYSLAWAVATEWLNYTVNVDTAGTYSIGVRVASGGAGGTFHIEVNGVDKTGPMSVPDTGGWQTWRTIYKSGVALNAGLQVWRLVMDINGPTSAVGNFNWIAVSRAFGGTPITLPGSAGTRIEAENFDEGGANVGYVDTETTNQGGQYRGSEAVDIETTNDSGGGYSIAWAFASEWLKYSVNVTAAGAYEIGVRVASEGTGGTFHIEVDGIDKTGPILVPNTGGWQTWTTITKSNVPLSVGPQVWQLVMDTNGPSTAVGNFNWVSVAATSETSSGIPYGGTPAPIPGRIEVENFNDGGAEIAYHDTDLADNGGGGYRGTQVDIECATDPPEPSGCANGAYSISWVFATEWLNYTVNVDTAGTYSIAVRVASQGTGGTFHIEVDGVDKTGPMSVPNTGGWQTWTTITKSNVALSAGPQVWRLVMDTNGPTAAVGNFNWISATAATSETTLRVVTFNLQDGGNYAGISGADVQAQFIASFHPDIVLLQETPDGNHALYRDLLITYTGRNWYSSPTAINTPAILSAFPLDEIERRYISKSSWDPANGLYAVRARITVAGLPLNIWPLHLDIGLDPCYCNGYPDEGMQTVVNWAAESSYNATRQIIGGDLNSWTVGSDEAQQRAIDIIRSAGYVDACLELGYDDYNCPRTNDNNWRPDAIYRSSGFMTLSQSVHPTDLSDHALLLTVIKIQ